MYFKITLEEYNNYWVYVLTLEKHTPTNIKQANQYADEHLSAEDKHGFRHYVLFKDEKIVQIQFHQALSILPYLNPDDPTSLRMPEMKAILFGNNRIPTLKITFKENYVHHGTAYALCPNVFLMFENGELAVLFITDVYSMIADPG
ncbi:MAG: hypothetical protein ACFFBD_12315 [Candidatus Hodarchaeota archaeon]